VADRADSGSDNRKVSVAETVLCSWNNACSVVGSSQRILAKGRIAGGGFFTGDNVMSNVTLTSLDSAALQPAAHTPAVAVIDFLLCKFSQH